MTCDIYIFIMSGPAERIVIGGNDSPNFSQSDGASKKSSQALTVSRSYLYII